MKRLEFVEDGKDRYDVRVVNTEDKYDWQECGELRFDEDQDAWVFDWGEEGVTYESSLEDTMEELRDEFEEGEDNENFTRFGNYQY
ncbi:hypothetical protein [Lactobacillus intestinalis]|uniref:hypothetical protein n=1 Tax=Lactobacillus intestinalis TaxID=151781 RepID=UPI003F680099